MLRDRFSAEQWEEIDQAAEEHGIDPDFLAAIILKESNGDWEGTKRVVKLAHGDLLPYVGLFQDQLWGVRIYLQDIAGDRGAQVRALAKVLRGYLDEIDPDIRYIHAAWRHYAEAPAYSRQTYGEDVGRRMKMMREERPSTDGPRCPECGGSGMVNYDPDHPASRDEPCRACGGSGYAAGRD